jgi:chromosome segregation ATPase
VGRSPENSVRFNNASVSRNHARVDLNDGGYFLLVDLKSRNGCFVNGKRVEKTELSDGDVIHFGEVPMVLVYDKDQTDSVPDKDLAPGPANKHAVSKKSPSKGKSKRARPSAKTSGAVDEEVVDDAILDADALPGSEKPKGQTRLYDPGEAFSIEDEPEKEKGKDLPETEDPASTLMDPLSDDDWSESDDAPDPDPAPAVVEKKAAPENHEDAPTKKEAPAKKLAAKAKKKERKEEPKKSSDGANIQRYLSEIAELTAAAQNHRKEVEQLESQIRQSEEASSRVSSREGRLEIEVEAISEKYGLLKEQSRRQTIQIEELRDEMAEKDEHGFDIERELGEVKTEAKQLREAIDSHQEAVNDLKVTITQRDRQIEEFQRQLDLTEYDLRTARDEIENLESGFNRESTDLHKTERRMAHLKEILEEKESHIEAQRLELQEKDQAIRLARMGVGIEDLEEEKRKVLEDFYKKNQEVENLNKQVKDLSFEKDEALKQATEAEKALKANLEKKIDVTGHPDYKALERKLTNTTTRADKAKSELKEAKEEINKFPAEDRQKLENEIRFLGRKLEATKSKLQTSEEARTSASIQAVSMEIEALIKANQVYEQWRGNLTLLKSYIRKLLQNSDDLNPANLEVVEGLEDLITVLQTDGRALGAQLARMTPDKE